jgi:hypothetical protein
VAPEERRIDFNLGNLCMLVGLMLPALSIVLQGPTPNSVLTDMGEGLQVSMCFCIFTGCGLKLHGALAGRRWYFPRTNLKRCYGYGVAGAPMAAVGAFVYGWFILSNTPTFLSALGGVSTPMFGLGIASQAVLYWLEARRIRHNEIILAARKKESGL